MVHRFFFSFDLYIGVKVTQIVTHFPIYHVTYANAKFETVTSKYLGMYAFTRKCII